MGTCSNLRGLQAPRMIHCADPYSYDDTLPPDRKIDYSSTSCRFFPSVVRGSPIAVSRVLPRSRLRTMYNCHCSGQQHIASHKYYHHTTQQHRSRRTGHARILHLVFDPITLLADWGARFTYIPMTIVSSFSSHAHVCQHAGWILIVGPRTPRTHRRLFPPSQGFFLWEVSPLGIVVPPTDTMTRDACYDVSPRYMPQCGYGLFYARTFHSYDLDGADDDGSV